MCVSDDPPVCLFLKHDAKLIFESRRAFLLKREVAMTLPSLMLPPRRFYLDRVVGHKTYNLVQATAQFPSS